MNVNKNMNGAPQRPIWEQPTPQQPTIAISNVVLPNQVLASLVVDGGYVPPVFSSTGTDPSAGSGTMHIVTGAITLTFTSSVNPATVTVTLSGAAAFSSATSYKISGMLAGLGAGSPLVAVYLLSSSTGTSLQFSATSAVSANFSVGYDFVAVGY
jgi:hypothetical protein